MGESSEAGRRSLAALDRLRALTAGRTLTGSTHDDADDDVGAVSSDDDGPLPLALSSFALPRVQFRVPGAAGDCCAPKLPWVGSTSHRSCAVELEAPPQPRMAASAAAASSGRQMSRSGSQGSARL